MRRSIGLLHAVGLSADRGGDACASSPTQFGLDPSDVRATVAEYNRAVRPGTFDPATLDDCRTEGLDAADKSHWALPHRHAAVLRLPAAAGHHVHLSRGRR